MNRKRNLKIISLILTISMIFVATSAWAIDESNDAVAIDENNDTVVDGIWFPEDLFEDEAFLRYVYEHLITEFGAERLNNLERARVQADNIDDLFPRDNYGGVIYPDFFGGMHFDDEGNLVVLIVDNHVSGFSSEYRRLGNLLTDDIIVRSVEFSYNKLNNTADALFNSWVANFGLETADNINYFGVDVINNRIEIHISILTEEKIRQIRETIYDSPTFIFKEAPGVIWPLPRQRDKSQKMT